MEKSSPQLIEEITDAMRRVARAWKFNPDSWLGLNLTAAQLKCLLFIDYYGRTNFRNLSDALGVTPPSITEVIDRLVEQELVSREENPVNRRMQILKTTAKGKALMAKLAETRKNFIVSLVQCLDHQDLLDLARIFAAIAKSLEEGPGGP